MRYFTFLLILFLTFLLPLFADNTNQEVLTNTKEITAYKYMPSTNQPSGGDSGTTPVTFRILDPTNNSVINTGADHKLTNTVLNESNYSQNKTFPNAFSWDMTGTIFKETITVNFKFGPLCSEELSPLGSMLVQDGTKVIPYTVTLSSNETIVKNLYAGNVAIGTTAITNDNYNKNKNKNNYFTYRNQNGYSFTVYPADYRNYSNNGASITTSPKTIEFSCSMYTNSYARYYYDYNYKEYINSCNEWTRSGFASITLGLNNNGYSWSETVNGEEKTYNLQSGELTYKANVIVTIMVQ